MRVSEVVVVNVCIKVCKCLRVPVVICSQLDSLVASLLKWKGRIFKGGKTMRNLERYPCIHLETCRKMGIVWGKPTLCQVCEGYVPKIKKGGKIND